jgi:uncharacterized membrane protein YeiH
LKSAQARPDFARLVSAADFAGVFVFAVEGALAGVAGRLDVFGVVVLSVATALGGGMIRDVLIGAAPPTAIRDWRYIALAVAAALLTFLFLPLARDVPHSLLIVLDAAGLSLFAVAGAEKALSFNIHPVIAALMGTITGVGGGTVRDLLLNRIPAVLNSDVYATAALAGAIVVVAGRYTGLSPRLVAVAGGLLCFALRLAAVWGRWQLPVAQGS